MDKLGLFTILIVLFVLYQLLNVIYDYIKKRWREGVESMCAPGCHCKGKNCK
jgi:hypothetical protein